MKKLLTVSKSKFYMLRVNFPQAFEQVSETNHDFDHDPLAERKRESAPAVESQKASVSLEEEDSEEARAKKAEVLAKDKARFEALDRQTAELVK